MISEGYILLRVFEIRRTVRFLRIVYIIRINYLASVIQLNYRTIATSTFSRVAAERILKECSSILLN